VEVYAFETVTVSVTVTVFWAKASEVNAVKAREVVNILNIVSSEEGSEKKRRIRCV
jgi:hypothetical protein